MNFDKDNVNDKSKQDKENTKVKEKDDDNFPLFPESKEVIKPGGF